MLHGACLHRPESVGRDSYRLLHGACLHQWGENAAEGVVGLVGDARGEHGKKRRGTLLVHALGDIPRDVAVHMGVGVGEQVTVFLSGIVGWAYGERRDNGFLR